MALAAGARIGPYEILSALGVGGMGEVYRARDPRLNRLIAIKVLPRSGAGDAERRERFEREAQAIAALNHPNIVTIHSVEEADGQFLLTMELVDGRSLADALHGGLPLDRLLKIAIPVADALAAAHQKGITHRDIKPANIMLGEGEHQGRVKVLDFGLAKLAGAPMAALGATALPTAPITGEGRILGTVAYMSPEQAEGKPIDARSDLFSLGVVLYEMATGQRPFTGDTSISIISSIIKDTPKSVTELKPALPRDLGRIVRRALVKDPSRRYQTAADFRNDLEELKASLDSGELGANQTRDTAASRFDGRGRPARQRRALAIAAGVAVLAIGVGIYVVSRRPPPAPSAADVPFLQNLQVTPLTTSGNAERPAISPDGKYVAYIQHDGDDSLWIRQTTTSSNVRIVAPEPAVTLRGATFTPDGTFVDFLRGSGSDQNMWRVPLLGGTPKLLLGGTIDSLIGWSLDGQHMAYLRFRVSPPSNVLVVADADGGHERELVSRRFPNPFLGSASGYRSTAPAWSPDGRILAMAALELAGTAYTGRAVFINSNTGAAEMVPLPSVDAVALSMAWLDGSGLVLNAPPQSGMAPQLFRLTYPGGTLSRLTNDPNAYVGVSLTADRQSLVTARREQYMDVWVGDGGGAAGSDAVRRVPYSVGSVAWAADRLLYTALVGGRSVILRQQPGASASEEVASNVFSPAATSDGRTLLMSAFEGGPTDGLWTTDAGGRRLTRLTTTAIPQAAVTPDDRFAVFTSLSAEGGSLFIVPIAGGTPTRLATAAGFPDVSPNGTSLVFPTFDTLGQPAIVLCDLPDCSSPRNIPYADSEAPRHWTPDGRGIAYSSKGNLWVQPIDGKPPRQLTHFNDGRPIGTFAWSRDGKRLAIGRLTVTNDIVLFTGLGK